MSESNTENRASGCLTRLIRTTLRVIFSLIIGLALGAGIYYGVVALFNNVIYPIQVNSIKISQLEDRMQNAEEGQTKQIGSVNSRLQVLEVNSDDLKASLDELQGRADALDAAQQTLLETATSELQVILDSAAESQQVMKDELANIAADLKSLRSEVNGLASDSDSLQAEIDAVTQKIADSEDQINQIVAISGEGIATVEVMKQQLQLFKAIELLTRSRYNLVQNNVGLASQDIQASYNLLTALQAEIPAYQVAVFDEILSRMESALANLPQRPVAAADDVDGAWSLLLQGLPDAQADEVLSEATPVPTSSDMTPTPTPTPTP